MGGTQAAALCGVHGGVADILSPADGLGDAVGQEFVRVLGGENGEAMVTATAHGRAWLERERPDTDASTANRDG